MKREIFWSFIPPTLFGNYSVLALFINNLGEVWPAAVLRPLVLVTLLAWFLAGVFHFIFKDWLKAGLMAFWSLFLLLSYGHIYNFARGLALTNFLARHRFLLPLWLLLFLGAFVVLLKWVGEVRKIVVVVNTIVAALILVSLFTLARHVVAKHIFKQSLQSAQPRPGLDLSVPQTPPDIYYILLDGYTRADVLSTRFGFDNGDFLDELEGLGFYIADCSRANYQHTHLTLPSLMNMAYIDMLVGEIPKGATVDSLRFEELTVDNLVMQSLRQMGYETVAFETPYGWAQFSEADYYYVSAENKFSSVRLSDFEKLFLDTTLVFALFDLQVIKPDFGSNAQVMPIEAHAERIQFMLETLKELPEMEGPQFIMAHFVVPHPPYIFNQDGVIPNLGDYNERWESGQLGQAGYINNIRYINQEILQVVQQILDESATPPMIIIQSDHGSDFFDRTMILSAFHLPGVPSEALYPEITPVNTFRLIFKTVFDAQVELLPDRALSGQYPPFDFQVIEETYPHCLRENR